METKYIRVSTGKKWGTSVHEKNLGSFHLETPQAGQHINMSKLGKLSWIHTARDFRRTLARQLCYHNPQRCYILAIHLNHSTVTLDYLPCPIIVRGGRCNTARRQVSGGYLSRAHSETEEIFPGESYRGDSQQVSSCPSLYLLSTQVHIGSHSTHVLGPFQLEAVPSRSKLA